MNRLILMLAMLLLIVSGCNYPVFENPLIAPAEAKPCPELFGAYKNSDKGLNAYLIVGSAGAKFPPGFLKMVFVQPPNDTEPAALETTSGVVFTKKVAGSYIVHFPVPKTKAMDKGKMQLELLADQWEGNDIEKYDLCRVKKTKTGLSIYILDEEFIANEIESGNLTGRIEQDVDNSTHPPTIGQRTVFVTMKTKELAKYFEETPLDKLFDDEPIEFKTLK